MVGAFLNSLSEDRLGVIEKQSGNPVIVNQVVSAILSPNESLNKE